VSAMGTYASVAALNKVRGTVFGFGEQYWKGNNGCIHSETMGPNKVIN